MPDKLKQQLLMRTEKAPDDAPYWQQFAQGRGPLLADINLPNPKLDVERGLMRLSEAYPEAMGVSTVAAPRYMDLINAIAAVSPFAPKTIFYDPGYTNSPTTLDETLAHELGHVQQLSGGFLKRFMGPSTRRAYEAEAERGALAYSARKKGDIRLK